MIKRWTHAAATLAVAALASAAWADDAPQGEKTFYKDVLPIFQQNCQSCHRPAGLNTGGMVAPMSLISYDEVRPWVKSIVKEVKDKAMPPWDAAPEFHGTFANERTLTEEQIATVVKWAESGAAAGDPAAAPEGPKFPEVSWAIGTPDLVVSLPKPYFVKDDVEDQYINFTTEITKEMLPEEKWIAGIEFKGSSPVVHHIIGYLVQPGAKASEDRGMLGGVAPGNDPDIFPEGYGMPIVPGSKLVFAMHYHKDVGPGTGVWDNSQVALKFHTKPVKHRLHIEAIGNHDFEIPAGHPNWEVGAARVFDHEITITELMPHMHLRGKAAKYVAFYPDGTKEVLLHVPKYDFNWQIAYEFKQPKRIPAGTRLEVTMHFDNSKENPANPDPGKSIRFGGPTTDEMMLGWLTYCATDPAQDKPADLGSNDSDGEGQRVASAR